MKICIQQQRLPGDSLTEKLDFLESIGVEGIEIPRQENTDCIPEYEAAFKGRKVRLVAICSNPTINFLNPDHKLREESIAYSKINLDICGHFGAVGQIVPPIFYGPLLPDLTPLFDPITLEYNLMAEIVKELAAHAAARKTLLLLEPLNRYEQHFLRTQADGVKLVELAGSPDGVALLSDFFHMHIEETDTPATFREVGGKYTKHVHMADNTRLEPGTGDIDFAAGLGALKEAGYAGYLSWECGLSGDPASVLKTSVGFINDILENLG